MNLYKELLGVPYPVINIETNEVGFYRRIHKVRTISNLAGFIVFFSDETENEDGVPISGIYVSYDFATRLIEDYKKGECNGSGR